MLFKMSNLQNSLTSPLDKEPIQHDGTKTETSFKLGTVLTESEITKAVEELNISAFTSKFPRVEKFYADPNIPNQTHGLVSFLPSKGATPDADGVYGMLKLRGNYGTPEECDIRAENLIRSGDSYHSIYHTYVGRPFPLARNPKFITETLEIDIKKKIIESTSEEVRKKRDEESRTIQDLEDRQKELLADVDPNKVQDPVEIYTELCVKKAQLTWTMKETAKKMLEMKTSILKTREILSKMDSENPECRDQYMIRYKEARKKAGLPSDDSSFIKYMGEDIELDFDTGMKQ